MCSRKIVTMKGKKSRSVILGVEASLGAFPPSHHQHNIPYFCYPLICLGKTCSNASSFLTPEGEGQQRESDKKVITD